MEDVAKNLNHAKDLMEKAIQHVHFAFGKIRAGKASPSMLDGLMLDYYGTSTPLNQVSSVNTPDARTITIKPWDKSLVPEIEKCIKTSDLGLMPQNDGEIVRLNVPALSEERRVHLVKQAKHEAEIGRVSIRNIRKDTNEHLKKLIKEHVPEDEVKKAELDVQKMTDNYISRIDDMLTKKEKDILTV
jgi:ribosome recycling factor